MFGPTRPRKTKEVTFQSPLATQVSPEPEYLHSSGNSSDIGSTCAVVGTSDEPKNTVTAKSKTKRKGTRKMTTTDESSDAAPKWTRNEDRIICTRKSEAKSWAEIGKELKRGRRECQQRHRALSSQAKELGITTAKLAKIYIEDDDDKSKPKKSAKDRDERTSKDNNEVKTDKLKAKHKGKSKDAANWDSKSETPPTSKTNKNKKQASETSSGSDSDPDSGSDSGPDDNDNDPEAEYWAQRRYIYDTQYSIMYPDQKVLRPDRFYSESDCRVLAGLEARYRANKWLYIQADFCNATGRMVEAEILKAKFYEDQNGGPFSSAPNG